MNALVERLIENMLKSKISNQLDRFFGFENRLTFFPFILIQNHVLPLRPRRANTSRQAEHSRRKSTFIVLFSCSWQKNVRLKQIDEELQKLKTMEAVLSS